MSKAIGALRRINRALHYASGAVLLAILAITVINIIGRRFNTPFPGSVEMTEMFMVCMVFLALSFGEDERVHITVDLLYERVGPGFQRVLQLFGRAVAILVVGLMIVYMWKNANSMEASGRETTIRQWPFHPFARLAVFGAVMLWLSQVANFLADLFRIEEYAEKELAEHEMEAAI